MGPCDIKESGKAWNDGIDAFRKAFKQSGGKTTPSITFAVNEAKRLNPDLNFDVNSFVDPLVASLKEKGLVANTYKYGGEKTSSARTKVEKIVSKLDGLDKDQKKTMARKMFAEFVENGMLDETTVQNLYAEAAGLPSMTESMKAKIKQAAKSAQTSKAVEDEIKAKIKEMQAAKDANKGKLSEVDDKKFESEFTDLGQKRIAANKETMKAMEDVAQELIENKFWFHQLTDYMPLNLMNPNSLAKNVTGAVVDWTIRAIGNTIAPPVSRLVSVFTGIHSNKAGARLRGLKSANVGSKAALAWKHNKTDFMSELPEASHLKAIQSFKKAMDASGLERWKRLIGATLKVHPSLISKGLNVPDAMAFEAERAMELSAIAESKGLKGAEKKAFMLNPDEKSAEASMSQAKKVTFKQDLPNDPLGFFAGVKKLSSYDPHKHAKELVAEKKMSPLAANLSTGAINFLAKSTVPFIKTPINIMRNSQRLVLPEYVLARELYDAKSETDPVEKQRKIIDAVTKASVGFYFRYVAITMMAEGLMSGGYFDEDKETKDAVEQKIGGPNRFNYSAFMRGMTFRSMKPRKDDLYMDMSAAGATGVALAAYAHAYSAMDKSEIDLRAGYNKDLVKAIFSAPVEAGWANLSTSLDFTFFTGINQLQSAFLNRQGYERNKAGVNYLNNIFRGIVPSTVSKLSQQYDPYVKQTYDKDKTFGENLRNSFGVNYFFESSDLKNKYFSMADVGGAKKKKDHVLFDNYLGRVLSSEFNFGKIKKDEAPDVISKLYEESRKVEKDERNKLFPAGVSNKLSIPYTADDEDGTRMIAKVVLTNDQYEYFQEQTSNYRFLLAAPVVLSPEFDAMPFDEKTKQLDKIYAEGRKYALQDLKDQYPDIIKNKDTQYIEKDMSGGKKERKVFLGKNKGEE